MFNIGGGDDVAILAVFQVGGGEVLVILLVALLVLGPERLPEAARKVGAMMGEIRRLSAGFQNEMRGALEIPSEPVVKPKSANGPTVRSPSPPAGPGDGVTTAEPDDTTDEQGGAPAVPDDVAAVPDDVAAVPDDVPAEAGDVMAEPVDMTDLPDVDIEPEPAADKPALDGADDDGR